LWSCLPRLTFGAGSLRPSLSARSLHLKSYGQSRNSTIRTAPQKRETRSYVWPVVRQTCLTLPCLAHMIAPASAEHTRSGGSIQLAGRATAFMLLMAASCDHSQRVGANVRESNGPNLFARIYDLATALVSLWSEPARWHYRLRRISVPALLEEIEADVGRARSLSLSRRTIGYLVRRRTVLTMRWRRTRCLLSGLLLLYLFARTGRTVTLHVGCRMGSHGQLVGHCWISSPGLNQAETFTSPGGQEEMYNKTVCVGKGGDSASPGGSRCPATHLVR
jgi:hypothetical protein